MLRLLCPMGLVVCTLEVLSDSLLLLAERRVAVAKKPSYCSLFCRLECPFLDQETS